MPPKVKILGASAGSSESMEAGLAVPRVASSAALPRGTALSSVVLAKDDSPASKPAKAKPPVSPMKTLMLHDVTNRHPPANVASRQPKIAPPSAAGIANHARHHVPRHSQS